MKKAQSSEIFFYILAIVIVGLLLLFGVRYIIQLGSKMNQVDMIQFKTELEGYANDIRPSYGKWEKLEISVPAGIDILCFVQHNTFTASPLYIQQQGLCLKDNPDYNFLMCNAWQEDTTRNVYTDPFDELDVGINLGAIDVGDSSTYYLCMDTSSGILKIKMTGKGDKVLIEEW
jgi:hypothetical protein